MRYIKKEAAEILKSKKPFIEKIAIFLRDIFAVQIIPIYKIRRNLIPRVVYGILPPLALWLFIEMVRVTFSISESFINYYNIVTIYLIFIVINTLIFGLVSGFVGAALSLAIIYFFYLEQINNLHLSNLSIAISFLLFASITLVASIANYVNSFNKIENLTKDRTLRAINRISRKTMTMTSMGDLVAMICKKAKEDLGGNFWIILKAGDGSSMPDEIYNERIEQALCTMLPDVAYKFHKTIYFKPIAVRNRDIGVLVAEFHSKSDRTLSLERVLQVLADQIAIMIDNFNTRDKLSKATINEEREKLRSLILSSISHDLKTPLSSIIGGLSVFKTLSDHNKLNKKNTAILINVALEESERLHGFIQDMLEMTRIESGAIKLDKKPLDPTPIVEKIVARFEAQLKEYQLQIALDQKIRINFDQISFEQIIQNLIDNTIKYSLKNTKITIYDEIAEDIYRIFIKDEGSGIDPTKLGQIFNKFERFTLEDKVLGSGLGLAIVKALMDANNATITAKNSDEAKGAIFILEFTDFSKNYKT